MACGRRQLDGSGGNGHALQHYEETGKRFPLCVKLGTITPAGGDVYSYDPEEDDMVEDKNLAKHLAHFGLNMYVVVRYNLPFVSIELCVLISSHLIPTVSHHHHTTACSWKRRKSRWRR